MSKKLSDNKLFYFCIPLADTPFDKLPIVITERYAYCRFYRVSSVINEPSEFSLVGVYDYLNNEPLKGFDTLLSKDLLFGELISYDPPLRGKAKWNLIGEQPMNFTKDDLPHLKFGNKSFFYLKDGSYYLAAGIETSYENVKHLENPSYHGDTTIKLKIICELIRRKAKDQNIYISQHEWEDIAFIIWRSDYSARSLSDNWVMDGVRNFLPEFLRMPIYSEVPREIRGKALDEVKSN